MIHVFVADEHPIVRDGIAHIIREMPDMAIAGESMSAGDIVSELQTTTAHVLILDISMSGRGGLDTIRELKRVFPLLPVLVLSMHPEEQFALRAMRAGASGYLEKSITSEELVKAIRALSNGKKYLSAFMMDTLASDLGGGSVKPRHDALSDREMQVLLMIVKGKKAQAIAAELSLSVRTINTYRARILQKMSVASNAGLVRYAVEHNLIE
jgi:DNA-binding NarL/FixJ family response regulator